MAPGKQPHFHVTNGKLVYCFVGINFLGKKKKNYRRLPNPLFPRGIQEISVRRHILPPNPLYILHPYKHTTEYISKRTSDNAGEPCFLNGEMPCPNIKKNRPSGILTYRAESYAVRFSDI